MPQNLPQIVDNYTTALSKKTPEEVGRLLQMLERDKYEYEQAKLLVERYELFDVNHTNAMIAACEKILKEKES